MNITTSITLNMQTPGYVVAYEPQGNKLSRFITATLKNGSASWSVPPGATAMIRVAKPDGTFAVYDKNEKGQTAYTISESTVTIELVGAALAAAGDALVTVMFLDSTGSNLSPFSFRLVIMPTAVSDDDIASSDYFNVFQNTINKLQAFYGAPLTAATASAMTDTTRVYVYVGSESGYVYGHWYYYNGSTWVNGGVYNSEGINSNWLYAAYPVETISNAVLANFSDGADDVPVKTLHIAINPVQNLHGYDHPWPGGGGKNKLPQLFFQHSSTMVYVGTDLDGTYATALPEGTYTLSASLTVSGRFYIRERNGSSNVPVGAASLTPSGSFTVPEGGGVYNIWLYNGSDGITVANINWAQLESGSTATEYEPYENVCPISGWTAAEIARTGSNLVSPFAWTYTNTAKGVTFSLTPENVTITGTSTGTNADSSNIAFASPIKLFAGQTYVFAINGTWSTPSLRLFLRTETNGNLWHGDSTNCQWTVTPTKDIEVHRIMLRVREENATVDVSGAFYANLNELGAYEPYKGTTYEISFGTAGTVYGGILTNNGDGTWKLEVRWFGYRFDTAEKIEAIGSYTNKRMQMRTNDIPYPRIKTVSTQLCSHAKYQNNAGLIHQDTITEAEFQIYPNDNYIFFALPGVDSLQGYKDFATAQMTAGTPLTFVSLVEESQYATYQLTGPEVMSLLGVNNVWADCGEIEELAYRADIGLYLVEALNPIKEMLAYREDTMKATRAYTTGDYIVVGDTFFKVTVPIANGATLTPGTNVNATTVGAQLKLLS